jgi:hypothetical protein
MSAVRRMRVGGATVGGNGCGGNFLDFVAADQNIRGGRKRGTLAVENAHVLEEGDGVGGLRCGRFLGMKERGDDTEQRQTHRYAGELQAHGILQESSSCGAAPGERRTRFRRAAW